ncbi:heavy metal translocating P-type ATPase [Desulfurococcus amylolyticus]|uniref:Heavy metal translocating P-type ATPase n=1 Tax=Desulfurococcus amylolyticus DSM 16532 TaxID=768672 RepID=I3XR09_DESAM|nr:cation-translocating P-type ATPase [Desulfurococcus amylolyticus]AFL66383.1 heavy metal translocating P-type ATPase [Desulfurococcus amylolyticus DSM 16532]
MPIKSEKMRIIGVDCPTCVLSINAALKKLPGVKEFKADVSSGDAIIVFDDERTLLNDIVKAVREAGYDVLKESLYIEVVDPPEGFSRVLEDKLRRLDGIIDAHVNEVTHIGKIIYNPLTTSKTRLMQALDGVGLLIKEVEDSSIRDTRSKKAWRVLRVLTLSSIGLLMVSLEILHLTGVHYLILPTHIKAWLSSIAVILSFEIYRRGFKTLLLRAPGMDSLIALSTLFTYLYSMFSFIMGGGELFFEASTGVLGFVSLGKFIEEKMRGRVEESIRLLANELKGKVRVERNGVIVEVEPSEVKPGEIVIIKAGEKILVDGVITEGWGYVDESMFTGEPIPVFKTSEKRDPVLSGTILTQGFIKVRVTRTGSDTAIAHIIEYMREATYSKPVIQRIADRIVGYLTWIVIALSAMVFTYWFITTGDLGKAVLFTSAVLAVTCPCPLGIAIPLVTAVSVYRASRAGILVRSAEVFERFLESNTIFFDKTGTLTEGEPRISKILVYSGDQSSVLGYVCSLEEKSEHVLAKAIVEYCREHMVSTNSVDDYTHLPGLGIIGSVNGVNIIVGSEKLVKEMNIKIPGEVEENAEKHMKEGFTVIYVAVNGAVAALLVMRDEPRTEAKEVIEYFKTKGFEVGMLTGDHEASARTIARELGINTLYSRLRPEDKAELIVKLQEKGKRIVYVGDGINDSVALSRAYLGVAMGRGSDVTRESGDVILVSDSLKGLIRLYKLSLKTKRKTIENLLWAFVYNMLLIPVAAGILYGYGVYLRPEYAAIAMILSDISVVSNSITVLGTRID